MRILTFPLALLAGLTAAQAAPLPHSILDATGDEVRITALEPDAPLAAGESLLVLFGTPDLAAVVLPRVSISAAGQLQLSTSQADVVNGRIGLIVATEESDAQIFLTSPERLGIDLDGDGALEEISFCLTPTQAWLTVTNGATQKVLREPFSLDYDAVATCTPEGSD
ncbi:hypothetical protein [Phaeobacter sp. HF9A]|uniref:hypothetical protein n=1 Tax=Phaeobacter sp. HF9A TaxID=2721561 RepID=UPI001431D760|nr:hypothetical protein [Phaeobacter sp. HF9A]NIZ15356.1 hypothetical protein [Phaeobacter sp. HF9A]